MLSQQISENGNRWRLEETETRNVMLTMSPENVLSKKHSTERNTNKVNEKVLYEKLSFKLDFAIYIRMFTSFDVQDFFFFAETRCRFVQP